MSDSPLALAVVPARGGSKRIPRKNIKPFLGVPLLVRTVGILKQADIFDRIVVSTDDEGIADVARSAGAEVPFLRPAELADDHTPTIPVIEHAVREIETTGYRAEFVCCTYPAAVLSMPEDLRTAFDMLRDSSCDYVFPVARYTYPIQRALRRAPDGSCEMFWPEFWRSRSQDLDEAFHDAGQFYFGRREAWLESEQIFSSSSRLLIIPHYRVQDIDSHEDWKRAESMFQLLQHDA
jgi:N-acylneuraminate cytidylyltransferase